MSESSKKWTKHFNDHTGELNIGDNMFADYQFNVTPGVRLPDLTIAIKEWINLYAAGDCSRFIHKCVLLSGLTDATIGQTAKPYTTITKDVTKIVTDYCGIVKKCHSAVAVTFAFGDADLWETPGFDAPRDQIIEIMDDNGLTRFPCTAILKSMKKLNKWRYCGEWESRKTMAQLIWRTHRVLHYIRQVMHGFEAMKYSKMESNEKEKVGQLWQSNVPNEYKTASSHEIHNEAFRRLAANENPPTLRHAGNRRPLAKNTILIKTLLTKFWNQTNSLQQCKQSLRKLLKRMPTNKFGWSTPFTRQVSRAGTGVSDVENPPNGHKERQPPTGNAMDRCLPGRLKNLSDSRE